MNEEYALCFTVVALVLIAWVYVEAFRRRGLATGNAVVLIAFALVSNLVAFQPSTNALALQGALLLGLTVCLAIRRKAGLPAAVFFAALLCGVGVGLNYRVYASHASTKRDVVRQVCSVSLRGLITKSPPKELEP